MSSIVKAIDRAIAQVWHTGYRALNSSTSLTRVEDEKISQARQLIAIATGLESPAQLPRDYDYFSEQGYQLSVLGFKCISMISRSASGVPWVVSTSRGRQVSTRDNHPAAQLLKRPNPLQGGNSFFESFYAYLYVSGNSYIEAVSTGNRPPAELYTLRPSRMQVVPGRSGFPRAYEYEVGGEKKTFPVNFVTGRSPILHMKFFHPRDDWYGLSPLESAAKEFDQFEQAGEWNRSMLRNRAQPPGALVFKPQDVQGRATTMGQDELDRLRELIESRFSGAQAARRPLILSGDFKWEQMGLTAIELDWLGGRDAAARYFCTALGVPPQLMGMPDSQNFSNNREARLSLWEETIIPLLERTKDELNNWLAPMYGDNVSFDYDLNGVSALTLRRQRHFEMVRQADYLTVNEKRAAVGYPPIEGGDVVMQNSTMRSLEILAEAPVAGSPNSGQDTDNNDEEETVVETGRPNDNSNDHTHRIDLSAGSEGETSEENGHTHTYDLDNDRTGVTNGHWHPIPKRRGAKLFLLPGAE